MLFEDEQILILHPGKCGGTTIEQLFLRALRHTNLARLLKEPSFTVHHNDQLTPWWLEDRLRWMVGYLPRRHAIRGVGGIYLQHADIRAMLTLHGSEALDSLYRIAFVRNPFPRVLSAFFYNMWDRKLTFRDFVLHQLEESEGRNDPYTVGHFGPLHRYTHRDGELYVDFLGRLESIGEDVARLAREVGVELDLGRERHHAKTSSSKVYQHYSEAYDEPMVEAVYRIYRRDFELFGYQFERSAEFCPRDAPSEATGPSVVGQ